MEDFKQKAKQSVLQQIMDLMDEKENGFLKSKSPKFAKVEVAAQNPEDLEMELDEAKDMLEMKEESEAMPMQAEDDDEDIRKLMSLYSQLKK